MSDQHDTKLPDALLARVLSGHDRPTRFEKEVVLSRVLEHLDDAEAPAHRLRLVFGALAAAALAMTLVIVALPRQSEFEARGAGPAKIGFSTYCTSAGVRGPCGQGSKLLFDIDAPAEQPYFAAFAVRADGARLWYFPTSEAGQSLDTRASVEGVATTAIVLGPEHVSGAYTVHGVFSSLPLRRADLRDTPQHATRTHVERPLVVE